MSKYDMIPLSGQKEGKIKRETPLAVYLAESVGKLALFNIKAELYTTRNKNTIAKVEFFDFSSN